MIKKLSKLIATTFAIIFILIAVFGAISGKLEMKYYLPTFILSAVYLSSLLLEKKEK